MFAEDGNLLNYNTVIINLTLLQFAFHTLLFVIVSFWLLSTDLVTRMKSVLENYLPLGDNETLTTTSLPMWG